MHRYTFLSLARCAQLIIIYTHSERQRNFNPQMSETPFRKVHTRRERKYIKKIGYSVCGMRRALASLRVGKRRRVPCTWIKGQVDQFTCCQSGPAPCLLRAPCSCCSPTLTAVIQLAWALWYFFRKKIFLVHAQKSLGSFATRSYSFFLLGVLGKYIKFYCNLNHFGAME